MPNETSCRPKIRRLLHEEGFADLVAFEETAHRYLALIEAWNAYAGLVAPGDIPELWRRHMADSLSLASHIRENADKDTVWVDIGSGGGFPAIPVKLLLPKTPLVLVERSQRKAGFLRKVMGALALRDIDLVQGTYPEGMDLEGAGIVTARAVEQPQKVFERILEQLPSGAVYLCQFAQGPQAKDRGFHVEPIEDTWSREGLRRGALYRIAAREGA
ncbi:MAG: 16S rRNA (guanine(527)-N(7))-methyltransferase RsmG [Candidatus Hydrogenedentota bacterium]